jgi:hypothetical protein
LLRKSPRGELMSAVEIGVLIAIALAAALLVPYLF